MGSWRLVGKNLKRFFWERLFQESNLEKDRRILLKRLNIYEEILEKWLRKYEEGKFRNANQQTVLSHLTYLKDSIEMLKREISKIDRWLGIA